jgi:lysophospholipase L1-like esterase
MAANQGFSWSRLAIRRCAAAFAMIIAGAAALTPAAPALADDDDGSYLALGDSVAFGYIANDGFAYVNPKNFVGYPYHVDADRVDVVDAACPGEASSGFIFPTGADNGCRPFRARFPLHVSYTSTQLDFAISFLATHRRTRLVTIQLGANDVFLLQNACKGDPACVQAGLPQTLATLGLNMNTILSGLRSTGFHGVIVVVNYYSLDYTDPVETGVSAAINQTLAAAAKANGAVVADAFTAFQAAASTPFAGGKTCNAGLLNVNPADPTQQTCDVHPAQSGHQLLAEAVEAAFSAATLRY